MQSKMSGTAASIVLLAGMFLANLAAAQTPELTAAQRKAKQEVEDRLVAILAKPYSGKLNQPSLAEVLASITRTTGLPIRVDAETLDEASIGLDTPVHVAVPGISLRAAMTMMLGQLDLTWVIRDGCLLVTTPEKASELLVVKVYPVSDLVAAADPTNPRALDCQPIIETIKKAIGTSNWDESGGPGAIGQFTSPGSLVVSQTFAAHEEIALLLVALRKARDRQHLVQAAPRQTEPAAQQALAPIAAGTEAQQTAEERIGPILEKPYSAKFAKAPLSAVFDEITRSTGLPIQLDAEALSKAQIALDTPVTCELPPVSLRSVLNVIVKQLDLAWTVENECVLVTISEVASNSLVTKVYPIQDLIVAAKPANPHARASSVVIQVITDSVAPTTWDDVGGPGEIVQFAPAGSLVVFQTFAVHEEIALLLAALRKARDVQQIVAGAPGNREPAPADARILAPPPGQPLAPGAGGGIF